MKEKKTWEKRVLSIVLAFAMVLTQFGVWNAGKESVQAAENDNFTLYYYCEDAEELYVNIWSWKALKFAEGETLGTYLGWNSEQAKMHAVENAKNWYYVNLQVLDSTTDDGVTIYNGDSSHELAQYDSKYKNQEDYAILVSGISDTYAIKDGTLYNNLKQAGLEFDSQDENDSVVKNAAVDVKKTDKELSSDFIMGMDISSMISELESGVVYRDYEGNKLETLDDICKFLADQGINHIRIRVWNNPYDTNGNGYGGGNNDVKKAKQFADACRNAGIKMLVDFHCSDLWTDPGKQQAPKAWKGYTVEQKAQALTEFITDSLKTIDSSKDVVDMVQVGNETTNGFIGETSQTNMCTLFSAGAQGVKNYKEDVKVVIHLTNPEKENMTAWAKILDENKVNYDILATSYYPYWHGTLTNLATELKKVKETYNKDVMVAETSYAYTLEDSDGHDNTVRVGHNDTAENTTEPFTEQGQATAIRNLINTVNNAGGLGVYYWEPAWLTVGDTTGLTGEAYDKQVAAKMGKIWKRLGIQLCKRV